jgi:hypothetical protein
MEAVRQESSEAGCGMSRRALFARLITATLSTSSHALEWAVYRTATSRPLGLVATS